MLKLEDPTKRRLPKQPNSSNTKLEEINDKFPEFKMKTQNCEKRKLSFNLSSTKLRRSKEIKNHEKMIPVTNKSSKGLTKNEDVKDEIPVIRKSSIVQVSKTKTEDNINKIKKTTNISTEQKEGDKHVERNCIIKTSGNEKH